MRFWLLPLGLSSFLLGCSGSSTTPKNQGIGFMIIYANPTNGAWAMGLGATVSIASNQAASGCGAFCGQIGGCAWTSVDPNSQSWGAIASSGSVVYLGQRQYLFGAGCGRSSAEASSAALNECTKPGISCSVLAAKSLAP